MWSEKDLKQLADRGVTTEVVEEQLRSFVNGFPFLELDGSASVKRGVLAPSKEEQSNYIAAWDEFLASKKSIVKFVPASGAASRMFKDMFEFLTASYDEPTTDFEKKFFSKIEKFAFYDALNAMCQTNEGASIAELIASGKYKSVVANMLEEKGLNYGKLPKGLLQFHSYDTSVRTAMEEHLAEGVTYAKSNGEVKIHFTVSPEHLPLFKSLVLEKKESYEKEHSIKYDISFSVQKLSTDTIAVDKENNIFREDDGSMLFRPGGHGALIENLNDIDADIIFIKNIDNVVPDNFKEATVVGKKLIAGVLVSLQKQIFDYIAALESKEYSDELLGEVIEFLQKKLYISGLDTSNKEGHTLASYLLTKLQRPLRVCGMVKNVGEPGGGPFFAVNSDGTISLQILESSQIDFSDPQKKAMFEDGTHFNPVDLVCATKDEKGVKYDLPIFVDKQTGFISQKSKGGRELQALELPGLWNGAMSNWNTLFVEVPIETFNPVKSVNDLLRDEHQ